VAKNYKIPDLSIGKRTLRTETAGIVSISILQTVWDEF
tara:strand:- start:145 stop:258 length:114 start_codon:yes stop_codon:yes gene_type:complete